MKIKIFALAVLLGAAAPALAQSSGEPYGEARAALLRQGWKPNEAYAASLGVIKANGAPLYHYPEVICGPAVCRAKWRDASGVARNIMLTRGVNQDHRVQ